MAWAYVIRSADRESFKRCRRAWDFSSRTRQNLEPVTPARVFDFDKAILDGLSVYYFPGMWEWDRAIVLPLAIEGFFKSMQKQRDRYTERQPLTAEQERDWDHLTELGPAMLNHYFQWATAVDDFSPIRVDSEFEVNIPDPLNPGQDLMARAGIPLRYRGRIDLLVVDGSDNYWLVKHRIAEDRWAAEDELLLDEQSVSYCWAWESFFLGMKIAGVIYNEIRKDLVLKHAAGDLFRRTPILRGRKEIKNIGRQLALEALDMTNPEVRLYPNPSRENCEGCAYVAPCIAVNESGSASLILETRYRKRGEAEGEDGRRGGSVDRGVMPPDHERKA